MAVVTNGITLAAAQRYMRGPGGLYYNFTSIAAPGTLLGETKGGAEFDVGYAFHDVEPDGACGLIKGHRQIEKILPVLTVSLLENTVTNWGKFIPGADSADETPTASREYLGTGLECQGGVALAGAGDTYFDTLEIWYGADGAATTKATITTDYTVNTGTGVVTTIASGSGGNIDDTDEVTAVYRYDNTASGDTFTIFTPAQIADGDYMTNVTLVTRLSNTIIDNPYFVFQLKNVLVEPNPISIPGDCASEAEIQYKFAAFFDPDTGTDIEDAPVEWWLGVA